MCAKDLVGFNSQASAETREACHPGLARYCIAC